MPDFDFQFIGVVLAAVVGAVVSFSFMIFKKVSEINEARLIFNNKIQYMESQLNKMSESVEELKSKQRLDTYRIDELKKKNDLH